MIEIINYKHIREALQLLLQAYQVDLKLLEELDDILANNSQYLKTTENNFDWDTED